MDLNTPHLPYESRPARRGSSSFANRVGQAMPIRNIGVAEWMQIVSIVVSAAVIWVALYYTR